MKNTQTAQWSVKIRYLGQASRKQKYEDIDS